METTPNPAITAALIAAVDQHLAHHGYSNISNVVEVAPPPIYTSTTRSFVVIHGAFSEGITTVDICPVGSHPTTHTDYIPACGCDGCCG